MKFKNGDIVLTRYHDESLNSTPGHWNHSAIVHNNTIIESIRDIGVIQVELNTWLSVIDNMYVMRQSNDDIGLRASNSAVSFIGYPYRTITSIFKSIPDWRARMGLNCVALVRVSYQRAFKEDPMWRIPDNILKDKRFVEVI